MLPLLLPLIPFSEPTVKTHHTLVRLHGDCIPELPAYLVVVGVEGLVASQPSAAGRWLLLDTSGGGSRHNSLD